MLLLGFSIVTSNERQLSTSNDGVDVEVGQIEFLFQSLLVDGQLVKRNVVELVALVAPLGSHDFEILG